MISVSRLRSRRRPPSAMRAVWMSAAVAMRSVIRARMRASRSSIWARPVRTPSGAGWPASGDGAAVAAATAAGGGGGGGGGDGGGSGRGGGGCDGGGSRRGGGGCDGGGSRRGRVRQVRMRRVGG